MRAAPRPHRRPPPPPGSSEGQQGSAPPEVHMPPSAPQGKASFVLLEAVGRSRAPWCCWDTSRPAARAWPCEHHPNRARHSCSPGFLALLSCKIHRVGSVTSCSSEFRSWIRARHIMSSLLFELALFGFSTCSLFSHIMTKGNSQQAAVLEEQRQRFQSAVCRLALHHISCSRVLAVLSALPDIPLSPPFSFLLVLIPHS